MKNWPKNYHNKITKFNIKFTHWLGKKLIQKPSYRWGIFESLRRRAKEREERRFSETVCPDEIKIDILSIVYIDVFNIEEFKQLEYGLQKIISKYDHKNSVEMERVTEWMHDCSYRSNYFGDYHIGWFTLSDNQKEDFDFLFDSFQIILSHHSPSINTLIFIVKPSELFKKQFTNLTTTNEKDELKIEGLNFKSSYTLTSILSGTIVREIKYDELFLKSNKAVVNFLRKYIGKGLSLLGPLKSIEVLSCKQSLKLLPITQFTPEFRKYNDFFYPLGRRLYNNIYYSNWYQLNYIQRNGYYNLKNMLAILSESDFSNGKKLENIEHEMYVGFMDELTAIGTLLSFEFIIENIEDSVLLLRNHIANYMLGRTYFKVRFLRQDISQIINMNKIYFKFQRFINELNKKQIRRIYAEIYQTIQRDVFKEERKEYFVDDVFQSIEAKSNFVNKQINFLKSSYKDFVQVRFTKSNYNIQIILIFLTIILAFLTFFMVLPLETQKDIQNYIKGILNSLYIH